MKSHVKKAREMGFSQEEIDEAAWMAIAFGGSPTMVFYNARLEMTSIAAKQWQIGSVAVLPARAPTAHGVYRNVRNA